MTDHPILFSAPMIRALVDGRKTQTRRLLTRHSTRFDGHAWPNWFGQVDPLLDLEGAWVDPGPSPAGNPGPYLKMPVQYRKGEETTVHRIYPRIQPGDQLWVREAHGLIPRKDLGIGLSFATNPEDANEVCRYRAECPSEETYWRPSIHMPRWASRLTLTVTQVRVQRLHEITEADARAEGAPPVHLKPGGDHGNPSDGWISHVAGFEGLWNSLHGRTARSRSPFILADRVGTAWAHNPWILAYTFTVQVAT